MHEDKEDLFTMSRNINLVKCRTICASPKIHYLCREKNQSESTAMSPSESLHESLRLRLSARPCKTLITTIAAEAMADKMILDALLSFLHEREDSLRWRAAWALEKVAEQCPSLLIDERSRMKALAMQADTPDGLRRLILGILHHLPDDEDFDIAFFNFLLDVMIDLQSPPGVQSLAMKLAYRQSKSDGDLHKEFLCIIRSMELDYYSAGVRSVVKKCLKGKL